MDHSSSLSPLDTFRSPGRVNWVLLGRSRAVDVAQAALDAAVAREVRIARMRIAAGWPRRLAAEHAFEAIGVTMEKYIRLGALDTEPCANIRLALEKMIPARGAFTGPRRLPKQLREQLDRTVQALKLSVRSANALKTARIQYLGELVQRSEADLLKMKNVGRISVLEIKRVLGLRGFALGMKLPGWTPPA